MTKQTCAATTAAAYVLLLIALLDGAALAQGVGANVGGTVSDETGLPLPGVTVTITNKATGASQVIVTGPEGNYRAVALQPAPYEISAELQGFATARREITLNVGTNVTVNLRLTVATLQETINVVAESPLVEVSKSHPTSTVVADQIASIPVLSRSFLELAQLLPGSGPDNSRSQAWTVTKSGGVADQRNGFTTIIDGGTINDDIWGSTLVNVSQDAVQEFTVFRNRFDAQYGSALAAAVAVATKSGSNRFSGSGFFFGRDRKLATRNAFAKEKPPFDQQRVGGSFGGPIRLNRTHFFGTYEYLNQYLALLAHSDATTISRPSIQLGSAVNAPQFFPRRNISFSDSLYISTPNHAVKLGGELTFHKGHHESYWNDQGNFQFATDAPFEPGMQRRGRSPSPSRSRGSGPSSRKSSGSTYRTTGVSPSGSG